MKEEAILEVLLFWDSLTVASLTPELKQSSHVLGL